LLQIRIYARGEVLDQADYALNVTKQTMEYFEQFFGVDYSLPKSGKRFKRFNKKIYTEEGR